ncbi:MAG: FAD-dependent oxidoreductase, partial [Desulfobacterales bacterium]|nr:FAD-dependent oxidoreductase [Desulfobacterales bacterium]
MEEKTYDLIIIGAGPAGLSAAIYSRRQGLSTTVFGDTPGGNLYMIESVKNYPGFHEGVPGMQLGVFMYSQAQSEGANFTMTNVDSLEKSGERFVAKDTTGNICSAPVAIIAAGSTPKRLNVHNAALDGIHYCAMCDGPLYRGKNAVIVVVGGGERGGHLCVFLSKIARQVILVDKSPGLKMGAALQKAVAMAENVEVMLNTEVQAFIGENELKGVLVSSPDGQRKELTANALFLSVGWVPNVSMIRFPVAASP